MKCPDCYKAMQHFVFRGSQIEECFNCQGLWFDRASLNEIKEKEDDDLKWLDFDLFGKRAKQKEIKPEGKTCPRCGITMATFVYPKSKVYIDKCSQCHGVWMHHEQFMKIAEYVESLIVTHKAASDVIDSFTKFLELIQEPEEVAEAQEFSGVLKLMKMRLGDHHSLSSKEIDKVYEYLPFL